MRIMISGSIAYDNILSYGGRFSDHLVRESLDHINLTFVTDSMTRNYGGCAANIAYALKLLGGNPVVTGAVGTDGSDYLYRFEQLEIETSVAKFNDPLPRRRNRLGSCCSRRQGSRDSAHERMLLAQHPGSL